MKIKHLSLAAFALLAGTAQALSFQWSSNILKFDGANLRNVNSVTGYLVYLGSGATLESSYSVDSLPSAVGTEVDSKVGTATTSKVAQTVEFNYGDYVNGDSFAMVVSYTSGADTYWNISSTVYTLSGITDERSQLSNATFTFDLTTAEKSSTVAVGGGWTSVPEPATAALALLGLGMLVKRRKA